ncbi:MAG TPA: outer membrane protein assembly factor BamA, partial [Gammaproteobacteria bacterium]|nr:outer membrane protein assembly factor BamA [Gammaproteobacteria bacterium]
MLVFSAAAVADFVVEDIRVDGAQNIEVGTIFNYLPIKVGDVADEALINQSIKALFATGFFQDVQIRRQEAILIVAVSERPAISDVEFTGNKDIDDESIEKALAQVGVTQGRIFREPLLEQLVQAIEEQYFARGRYSATVDAVVTPVDLNRVSVSLTIDEGRVARIREINIVGNEIFTDKELLSEISLGEERWHSFISQIGQYSKEELLADSETLRSFYLDSGYMNFELLSSDVTISQNKQDIFITFALREGDLFRIGNIDVEGGGGFSAEEMLGLIDMP